MTFENAYGMTVTMMRRVKIRISTVGMIDLMSWQESYRRLETPLSHLETDPSVLQDGPPTPRTERPTVAREYRLRE